MTNPNNATIKIVQFFDISHPLGPSDVPQAITNSMVGGKANANADEHSAPINDMKRFRCGTSSDMTTRIIIIKESCIISAYFYEIKSLHYLHVQRTNSVLYNNSAPSGLINGPYLFWNADHVI